MISVSDLSERECAFEFLERTLAHIGTIGARLLQFARHAGKISATREFTDATSVSFGIGANVASADLHHLVAPLQIDSGRVYILDNGYFDVDRSESEFFCQESRFSPALVYRAIGNPPLDRFYFIRSLRICKSFNPVFFTGHWTSSGEFELTLAAILAFDQEGILSWQ